MLSRMKYINRWGLMNNTRSENISEHSLEVAMIAHCLATLGNVRLGKRLNADHIAVMGLFHDSTEIITGDMPTPVKYYNEDIRAAYKRVEDIAKNELLDLLPEDLRPSYEPIFDESDSSDYSGRLVKGADKLSAYIKCIEEIRMGNDEFKNAMYATEKSINELNLPEVDMFMSEFIPSYKLTLDEQKSGQKHDDIADCLKSNVK